MPDVKALLPTKGDAARLIIMALAAGVLGMGVNFARSQPLPLRYQSASAALVAESAKQAQPVQWVSFEALQAVVGRPGIILLDARPAIFYRFGHIPGALNIPRDEFDKGFAAAEAQLRSPATEKVIVYCSGGDCEDSAKLVSKLTALGIGSLAIYEGGWDEWNARTEATRQ